MRLDKKDQMLYDELLKDLNRIITRLDAVGSVIDNKYRTIGGQDVQDALTQVQRRCKKAKTTLEHI